MSLVIIQNHSRTTNKGVDILHFSLWGFAPAALTVSHDIFYKPMKMSLPCTLKKVSYGPVYDADDF